MTGLSDGERRPGQKGTETDGGVTNDSLSKDPRKGCRAVSTHEGNAKHAGVGDGGLEGCGKKIDRRGGRLRNKTQNKATKE